MERWADTVLRVACTWTGNPQDAQDVCQTVLLKLLTCPERFPDPNRERFWVLRVTVNCCKDLKKSAWGRRRVSLEAAADAAVTMPEPGESPVLEAVLALPEKYRQIIYLRYYEEYGVDEIAALLGCKPAQVSTWLYRGMAAAVAAVVLAGSALAAGTLWDRYFGHLDEGQQEVIETLSRDLPAAESNGTTMTPLAAFGDQDFYYLMLEIKAPEGTVLRDYGEDEGYYQLFGDTLEEDVTLTDAGGQDVLCTLDYDWFNDDPSDNVLTAVIRLWSMEDADLCDGTDKVLHIPGLWVQSPDKIYTPVLTGGWDFNIGAHSGGMESLTPDVAGVTVEDADCGVMTMEYLRLSPLGMRIRHSWSEPREGIYPGAPLSVVMEDGSEVFLEDTVGSCGENWNEEYGPFETPIDLDKVAAVRWGTAEIPLN